MGCKQVEGKNVKPENPTNIQDNDKDKVKDKAKESKDDKAAKPEKNPEIIPVKSSTQVNIQKNDKDDNIEISLKYDDTRFTKSYSPQTKVAKIIEDFQQETRILLPKENEVKWYINKVPIDLTEDISQVIPKNNTEPIEISYDVLGLSKLADNYSQILEENTLLVGKPLSDPFEVIVFDKEYKSIRVLSFGISEMNNTEITKYSNISSFCNGDNTLYISGGEFKHLTLGDFWIIDLNQKELKRSKARIPPRKQHSMIYIPHRYVFIVGGNSLNTMYYDTVETNMYDWADLNYERKEPALVFINNKYLYAISNVKKNKYDPLTFEKTNLLTSAKWEIIQPKFSHGSFEFNQKFFGICDVDSGTILFLGGFMSEEAKKGKCFEFDVPNETIKESKVDFLEFDFPEKTFIPFNQHASFILPNVESKTPIVVVINKKDRRHQAISFVSGTPQRNSANPHTSLYSSVQFPQRRYFYNMPKGISGSFLTSPKERKEEKVYVNVKTQETPKPIETIQEKPEKKQKLEPVIEIPQRDVEKPEDILPISINIGNEIEVVKAKKEEEHMGSQYIKNEPKEQNTISGKNFGGSLIRTSVISTGNKMKRSGIPGIKKNSQQLSGSKIGISNEFNKDGVNDLKSSKVAGIEGRKIVIETS